MSHNHTINRHIDIHTALIAHKLKLAMADEVLSLESILEKHIPESELKEVNRILYGSGFR